MEGAALHHNVPPQLLGRGQLDHFVQGIFDDGVGQSRRNIRNRRPLLLGLLHIGVHKHGAAGAQIHRAGSKQRLTGKGRGGIAHGIGKVGNKGAASGGAGFIEHDAVHRAVFQLDALHILTANVQDTVHLGVKEGSRRAVGNGLHHPFIQGERGFQQGLAIAGGAAPDDPGTGRQLLFQLTNGQLGGHNGVSLVVAVEAVQKLPILADEGQLGGGGTGINAQEAVAGVGLQRLLFYHRLAVPAAEFLVFFMVPEKGLQPGHFRIDGHAFVQQVDQFLNGNRTCILRLHGSTHGCKQVGVRRIHRGLLRQLQGADKGRFQFCQEVQRASQECHTAPDGLAAGQTGNGLIHHRLENRSCQISTGGPLVDQGLDIRLGKHAAPGGNGIDLFIVLRRLIQPLGIGLQQRCHLVNKGTGSSGAHAVHPFLQAAGEIDDLGILTPQLNGHVGLGGTSFQGSGHSHHLLNKFDLHGLTQVDGTGAGDLGFQNAGSQGLAGLHQQVVKSLLGMGVVSAVLPKKHFPLLIENHQLDCGGADINASLVCIHFLTS